MVWPQENQLCYPTLFRLALDVLAIQASAVPCEQVFSSAKATMALRRNRIKLELMEALQLLKFSV
jgi:hAT family C-terminal dimerisation region